MLIAIYDVSVLDHYYIGDYNNVLYVVVGNNHPPGYIIAYPKYVPSQDRTIWCKNSLCFERVVKYYGLDEIYGVSKEEIYYPLYGASVPCIRRALVREIYDPVKRALEIMFRPHDVLEEEATETISMLRRIANIPSNCIGLTGSLLIGIHNVDKSDIDLVIYTPNCSWRVVEALEEDQGFFRVFNKEQLIKWAKPLVKRAGLDIEYIIALYRNWRRGVLPSNRLYSITYSVGYKEEYNNENWITTGAARIKAFIEPSLYSLNYPSHAIITEYIVLKKIYGDIKGVLRNITCFENLYLPALTRPGWRIIEGIIQYLSLIHI